MTASDSSGLPTAADLDAIEARAAAATEGPWSIEYDSDWDEMSGKGSTWPYYLHGPHPYGMPAGTKRFISEVGELTDADAEFIAHARTDVDTLLAAVREVTARAEAAEAERDDAYATGVEQCRRRAVAAEAERDALRGQLDALGEAETQWRAPASDAAGARQIILGGPTPAPGATMRREVWIGPWVPVSSGTPRRILLSSLLVVSATSTPDHANQ